MKKYTLQEIIDLINKDVLGVPQYGFEDEELWGEFKKKTFFREGEIDGEKYSSQLNTVLSGAAVSHTLGEIRLRLSNLLKTEE